jgi:uncharacterized protein (TIGR03382 family)
MQRATFALAFVCAGLLTLQPTDARACGGCFHEANAPSENTSVVTDHRMALAVSTTQTVLWDQVRYQGNPKEFAWVLPVGQGAQIELARDEFLQALNLLTAVQVTAPPVNCPGGYGGGGGAGCGAGGSGIGETYGGGGSYGSADAGFEGNGDVNVVSQSVVGPYLAVTIRSSSGEAISQWLIDNGFAIPTSMEPVLEDYTKGGFDFIALRLAPNVGVQAMQPVRVVTPGADPTLPLRMVAAGIGSSVGLELYVISGGRYETVNFPALTIDPNKIEWDPNQARSNYTDTFASIVGNGAWVTEFSGPLSNLASTYKSACYGQPLVPIPVACSDGGASSDAQASDAQSSDAQADDAQQDDAQADDAAVEASTDDAQADDAQADAGTDDAQTDDADLDGGTTTTQDDASSDAGADSGTTGSCVKYVAACTLFDDYDTATVGLSPYGVWVTRLRTVLPNTMLDKDLQLGASKSQTAISNRIQTSTYTVPYDPCPSQPAPTYKEGCGCATAGDHDVMVSTAFASLALLTLVRRRRK